MILRFRRFSRALRTIIIQFIRSLEVSKASRDDHKSNHKKSEALEVFFSLEDDHKLGHNTFESSDYFQRQKRVVEASRHLIY